MMLVGLLLLTVVAGAGHALDRYLWSMYAGILGLGLVVVGALAAARDGGDSPARRLAGLARLTALLLGLGFAYTAAAFAEGAYGGEAPFAILIPLFVGVPLALVGLARLVQRSEAAAYGCLAILILVMSVAAYCSYAVVELLLELPQLFLQHAQAPSAVHFFNAVIGTCVLVMALTIPIGIVCIVLAGARRSRPVNDEEACESAVR